MTKGITTQPSRIAALSLGGIALLAALYAGLARIGWEMPGAGAALQAAHGPLMVCGFMGAVIGLERAGLLGRPWGYAAAWLPPVGALLVWALPSSPLGALVVLIGSAVLLAVVASKPTTFRVCLATGAALWVLGNALWVAGRPLYLVVPLWIGFLALSLAGSSLESSAGVTQAKGLRALFGVSCAAFALGLLLAGYGSLRNPLPPVVFHGVGNFLNLSVFTMGARLAGAGAILMGLWLIAFGGFGRAVRAGSVQRFVGVSLLSACVWLVMFGVFWVIPGLPVSGPGYDCTIHAFFLGFVFCVIFAQAPTMFRATFPPHKPVGGLFYGHLALLHASLLLRIAGDMASWPQGRLWGGLLNAIVILLFLPYHSHKRTEGPAPV